MSDDEQGGYEADDAGKKKQLASTLWGDDGADDIEDEEDFAPAASTARRGSTISEGGADDVNGGATSSAGTNDPSRASQREDRETQREHLRMLQERRERARREQQENQGDTSYAREVNIELEDGPRPPSEGKAFLLKLSSQFGFNATAFDPNTYDWSTDKKPDEDANERPRTENIMRWRWTKNQFQEYVMQSNTQLVQWSDGSFTFHVGKTTIPAKVDKITGDHQLFTKHKNNVLRSEKELSHRLTPMPPPSSRPITKLNAKAKAGPSKAKTRIVNDDIDPQLARKQQEEIEYQKARIEAKLREQQFRKRKTPDTLTVGFLEDDDEEGDDNEKALQEELAADRRLLAAKQGLPKAKRRKTQEDGEDEDVDMSDDE